MKLRLAAGLLLLGTWAQALDLPPLVREAVRLELEGRLGEALDRYRAALSAGPEVTGASPSLEILVLSKASHLSVDLGYGEEAWDLGGRLLSLPGPQAAAAGTLVRMRSLRLQDKGAEALALYDSYRKSWPQAQDDPSLAFEVRRLRPGTGLPPGPASWVRAGAWSVLPSAAEAFGLTVRQASRLQIGVFQDWGNALTLIDMLREKGWVPFTEVKTGTGGTKLHVVYVVSRQPDSDMARLRDQGLTDLP